MENKKLENIDMLQSNIKINVVLKIFDRLMLGEHITLLYDQDPLALYYDLLNYREGQFEWKYLEAGPEIWMVKITNIGNDYRTVADVLLENHKAAEVFSHFNIDYCCKGQRLFTEACKEIGVEPFVVLKKINEAVEHPNLNEKANSWPLDFLIDYILIVHHSYVKEKKPAIIKLIAKVQDIHGEIHPELYNINLIFNKLAEGLRLHMQKEEILVFPAIKTLIDYNDSDNQKTKTLEDLIRAMKTEHDEAGEGMADIRKITENYAVPEHTCNSFKLLYTMLEDFEKDLHNHVHLENNILFPKALALNKELN